MGMGLPSRPLQQVDLRKVRRWSRVDRLRHEGVKLVELVVDVAAVLAELSQHVVLERLRALAGKGQCS